MQAAGAYVVGDLAGLSSVSRPTVYRTVRRTETTPLACDSASAGKRVSGHGEGGGGYFPACQSCLDAFINEAQSSGGCPRASILANTVYGSDLLPEERSVDRSLTHA